MKAVRFSRTQFDDIVESADRYLNGIESILKRILRKYHGEKVERNSSEYVAIVTDTQFNSLEERLNGSFGKLIDKGYESHPRFVELKKRYESLMEHLE